MTSLMSLKAPKKNDNGVTYDEIYAYTHVNHRDQDALVAAAGALDRKKFPSEYLSHEESKRERANDGLCFCPISRTYTSVWTKCAHVHRPGCWDAAQAADGMRLYGACPAALQQAAAGAPRRRR